MIATPIAATAIRMVAVTTMLVIALVQNFRLPSVIDGCKLMGGLGNKCFYCRGGVTMKISMAVAAAAAVIHLSFSGVLTTCQRRQTILFSCQSAAGGDFMVQFRIVIDNASFVRYNVKAVCPQFEHD